MSKPKAKTVKKNATKISEPVTTKKNATKVKKDESSEDFEYEPSSSEYSESVSEDLDSSDHSDEDEADFGEEYDIYIKKNIKTLTKNHPGVEVTQLLKIIAHDFIASKNKNKKKKEVPKKSYWLVYTDENGDREDCNVFYSYLVKARTEHEALVICAVDSDCDIKGLGARPMDVLTIDTMNKHFLRK
uniref:Uncharacterized protein n=1 Tax=viral metagenome TaxID=1070528 RepID=A0A6C0C6F1_9ZZZZ